MAKVLRSIIRKTLFGKRGNLVSLDDPFSTLARLLRGRTVRAMVDAGASDGRVSRRMMEQFPEATVYAFEPNPAYQAALRGFAERDPRFKPQFSALAAAAGVQTLNVARSPGATSLFQPSERLREYAADSAEVVEAVKVPVTTLDSWAKAEGVSPIGVIKLDIQGGELGALQGAQGLLRDSVMGIYTEVLFSPLYQDGALFGEIDAFLRANEFALYNFYGPKTDRAGALLWANAIYVRNDAMTTGEAAE